MTPKNKQNEFLIKVSLYLLYLLPFFLGLGAFIPNIFYLILFSIFIYFIFNKQIKFSEFNNIFIKLLLLFWSISVLSSFFQIIK